MNHEQIPLLNFEFLRPAIKKQVIEDTLSYFSDLEGKNLELLLGETLYTERFRLKRHRDNIFTKPRTRRDKKLWGQIQSGLLKSPAESERRQLLGQILEHYTEEIAGHFNYSVFRFATTAVPWGFNWLLNAASLRHFLPWKLTEALSECLIIDGHSDRLRKLSQHGTILLVPTHQSNLDSLLIGFIIHQLGLPPFSYGAGLNLFFNPVFSFFMNNLGAYTVDRQKNNALYKNCLKNYSTAILQHGIHSIFFPGGTRSRSGAIESKLKLGLLGTALRAQTDNYLKNFPKPDIFVVPLVVSYHSVLEAQSLIEDFLAEAGKHRYIIMDDESWQPIKVLRFFWRFFSSKSSITVRFGEPMDVFGNPVDDEGQSQGPNGTTIQRKDWLTTCGSLKHVPQRDEEYTFRLGKKIIQRFHTDHTVIDSHWVAFTYFEALRKKYPDQDLYRFLRLSPEQRTLPLDEFYKIAELLTTELKQLESQNKIYLSPELQTQNLPQWVQSGAQHLGPLHDSAAVKLVNNAITTEDMNLLYYYRNRLTGYGLNGALQHHERKGFLE